MNNKWIIAGISLLTIKATQAQQTEDKKLHLTTGIGINKIQGELSNTFRSTIAFNSGFEKKIGKNGFAQLDVNFNSLKYDQQKEDEHSDFLFQNTSSSLFMIGLNAGRDFTLSSKWFTSLYAGTGYLNIGEPRITIDEVNDIATQDVIRRSGLLGKGGGRIGLHTRSSLLQTIYIDASYWSTTIKIRDERFRSFSIFAGIRMAMTSEHKAVKRQMKSLIR